MTLLQALTETGLLEDFKDICTPDVTAKEALQWLKRRPQLIEKVSYWPSEKAIQNMRWRMGCRGSHGGRNNGERGEKIMFVVKKPRPKSAKPDIAVDCGRQSRRYAPTDDSFYE